MAGVAWGVYTVVAAALPHSAVLNEHTVWGFPFKITAGLIFVLLVPMYLCFYALTELTSPSQKILNSLSRDKGLSFPEILNHVDKEDLVLSRLNDLCASGCVVQADGGYVLSAEGRSIAMVLDMMQAFLGREAGG
jgi:hypothetical protein